MSLSKIPRILFEDQEILVCHKPSGVPAQTNRIGTPDLVSILKNHLRKESRSPYLALIHRLDQPVEGLMVFAKTYVPASSFSLRPAFRSLIYIINIISTAAQGDRYLV